MIDFSAVHIGTGLEVIRPSEIWRSGAIVVVAACRRWIIARRKLLGDVLADGVYQTRGLMLAVPLKDTGMTRSPATNGCVGSKIVTGTPLTESCEKSPASSDGVGR